MATKKTSSRAKKPLVPTWQVVENVYTALERIQATVPGTKVTQKAQVPDVRKPTRFIEVDVLIEFRASGRDIRIGVDVKNEASPLTTNDARGLIQKRNEMGLNEYSIVSTSGYDGPAEERLKEAGIQALRLEPFLESATWAPNPTGVMKVVEQGGRIAHVRFDYPVPRPDLVKLIKGLNTDKAVVEDFHGATASLTQVINQTAHQQVQEARRRIPGLQYFETEINFAGVKRIVLPRARELPVPLSIRVLFELHEIVRENPEHRFRIGGIEMSTTVHKLPDGQLTQYTIIMLPPEKPGEGKRIAAISHPANPKQTKKR